MTNKKPLRRTPMPPRKTPMPRGSLKPSASGGDKPAKRKTGKHAGESKAKRLAKKRSGGLCEIRILAVCVLRGLDFHHRLFRSQGGKWEIVNGLFPCRPCHMAVTNTNGHREEYERFGWIVPSHKNPAEVPVRMWHDERCDWFLLLEDGSVELAPWPERDERHPDDLGVPRVDPGLDGAA